MHPRVLQFPGVLLAAYVLSACPPPADNSRSRTNINHNNNRASSGSSRTTSPAVTSTPAVTPTSTPAVTPTTTPTPTTTTPTRAGAATGTIEAPQGVTAVTTPCNASTPETCNGLDDNCDGVIDNNCGYAGGGIQITANWRGAADVDLRVTDPASEEVYFGHRGSASGGQMDIEANGDCTATRPPTAENVRWSTQTPPAGRYEIKLVAMDLCGSPDAAVTFSVSVGGRIVGAWTVPFTYPRQEYVFPLTVR